MNKDRKKLIHRTTDRHYTNVNGRTRRQWVMFNRQLRYILRRRWPRAEYFISLLPRSIGHICLAIPLTGVIGKIGQKVRHDANCRTLEWILNTNVSDWCHWMIAQQCQLIIVFNYLVLYEFVLPTSVIISHWRVIFIFDFLPYPGWHKLKIHK